MAMPPEGAGSLIIKRIRHIIRFLSKQAKLILSLVFLASVSHPLFAQNDPQFSLGSYNRMIYNPAAIAQSEYVDIMVSAREQWTGFEEAPSTQSLSVSNYFDSWRMGLGLSVVNDKLGAENIQNVKAKYAYHVWLSDNNYLSFGLGAGVMMKSFSSADLIFEDPTDEHIADADMSKTRLDFDLGFEWHVGDIFMGAAVNHLTQSNKNPNILKVQRHQYAYAGVRLFVNDLISLRPSVNVFSIENIYSVGGEIAMNYDDSFWFGLGYRNEDAFLLSTKIRLFENLIAAYSYDLGAGDLASYREGSHEIMLHLRINKPQKKYRSPRFFD